MLYAVEHLHLIARLVSFVSSFPTHDIHDITAACCLLVFSLQSLVLVLVYGLLVCHFFYKPSLHVTLVLAGWSCVFRRELYVHGSIHVSLMYRVVGVYT